MASGRKVEGVLPRVVDEGRFGHHRLRGEEVALGVLDREDVRMVGESEERLRRDRHPGATGDVVEHDGQVRGVRRRPHVRGDRRSRRLRIVGGDDEEAVRAGGRRALTEVNRVRGDIVPGAGDELRTGAHGAADDPRSSIFSSSVVVGDSPVVPETTSMSLPSPTRWSATFSTLAQSMVPSSLNGVTIAVPTVPNASIAAVAALSPRIAMEPGYRRRPHLRGTGPGAPRWSAETQIT